MKRVFLLLMCFVVCELYAQQIVTYNFSPCQQLEYEDGFSELLLENCSYINEEGQPNLPVFVANILLEPGHEINAIQIQRIEYYPTVENINIRPASANFPISKGAPDGYKALPNPDIYNLDKDYPEYILKIERTSFLRGHAIGTLLIYPIQYNPVQKGVDLIKSITLEIYSQATPKAEEALKFLRNDHNTIERVQQAVKDKDESILNSYNTLKRDAHPNYDILVITKQDFTSTLNNYISHKNKWGYKILVKTVEDIYAAYTGMDNAEKVRNCVIDAYENEGISYLMLFGDSHQNGGSQHNIIPYRRLYVNAGGTIDDIPSDMYFACLDGTWYNSNTGKWGEYGYNDLNHEISVGRICADNTGEIETFITKLINYQETPVVDDLKKALMVGEQLNDNPVTWGGDCKDQIINGGTFNGYTTTGIPSNIFTISKLYEREGYWSKTDLINRFKNGTHLVNHLGHSGTDYNMKLSNYDVTNGNFTNTGVNGNHSLAIVYSQGCYNGAFDNEGYNTDCINEMFHKVNGGVVANIGNSRYGWYNPGGTNGPSQRFDRHFFDGIFEKNIYTIGDANTHSKDVNASLVQNDAWLRWCCYELTLLGDPSMDIWTDEPTNFDPLLIKAVKSSDTEISVSTGVPYARVAVLQNNVLLSRGACDEDGNAMLVFDEPFNPATILLSVSGHNKYRYEQQGITFTDAPPVRNLTADAEAIRTTLNWEEPNLSEGHEPPVSYLIYRNGTKVGTVTSNILTYKDNNLTPNTTYEYCVRALYTDCVSVAVCVPTTTDRYCLIVTELKTSVKEKKITLYWTEPDFPPEKYTVLRDGEFLKEVTQTIIIDNVPKENTIYEYCVIAHYDGCDSEPACIKVKSGVVCGAIDEITYTVDVRTITLSWNHLSPNELVRYVITRDGVVIKDETTETSLIDIVPEEDTEYNYCITAEFENCTSDEKCEIAKSGIAIAIPEEQSEMFQIFPNPAHDYITVMGAAMQQIIVYDITGKIIREINLSGAAQSNISVSGLENGMYLLRIYSEGNIFVKRFSVMK